MPKSSRGFNPRIVPASNAARKQPEPVDVSQLKSNFAFSAVGFATTGCARDTALCRYGKSQPPRLNAGVVTLFIAVLIVGNPQHNTKIERIANGIHAFITCPVVCGMAVSVVGAAS